MSCLGCGSVLVVDGGLKAQRKICGAVKSGVKVFENSNTTLVTGCTKHPGDNKYCKEHRKEETPAVSSSKLDQDNKSRLRSSKQKQQVYMDQDFTDSVYIIEEILGSRKQKNIVEYHIKWEGYSETTWEPSKNIPSCIRNYFFYK